MPMLGPYKNKSELFLTSPKCFMSIPIIVTFLLIMSVDFTTPSSLSGSHFNFIAFQNPPFDILTRGPNGTFTYSGSSIRIVDWLAKRFNFTVTFVPVNETLINKLGTHEATYYLLMNDKDIEGIGCAFYLTMDRVERFDYTASAWSEGFSFVAPRPGQKSRLFAFIGPFQPLVWMSIFISLIFVIGTMTFFTWLYNYHYADTHSIPTARQIVTNNRPSGDLTKQRSMFSFMGFHMIYVINTITNQGCRELCNRTSFRFLAGAWVLCAMVLVNSYTGIVTSSLTTPKMKPPINTLEELAASKEVKIVLRSDTSTGVQILQATSGIYKVLGDQVRSEPGRIFDDPFKLATKLQSGHFAYPFVHTFSLAFIGSQYKKDGKCRFKVSKILPLSSGHYSFLFKRGTWYTKTISKGILELWEGGFVRFWVNHLPTLPRADECFAENKHRVSRIAPIQLTDLASAFLILGIGIGLATLTFLLETINWKWRRFERFKFVLHD